MPLDLFGDLFELCLDLNPKSGTEGPNGISITHHQDQDQDQDTRTMVSSTRTD